MFRYFSRVAAAAAFVFSASTAMAAPLNVLHVGSHLTNYTSVGSINVTKLNGSSLNGVDLSLFDVIYADEHAYFGSRSGDISNAIHAGELGFVAALTNYNYVNSILGTTFSNTWSGVSSLQATTAPSALLTGAGLPDGGAVNLAAVNNQSRGYLNGSGWDTVLVEDQNNRAVVVEGTFGQGNWIYMGLEPMEYSSPNADESQLVWNALQIASGANVAPVPLPAGLPLMLAGVGVFGFIARRKAAA